MKVYHPNVNHANEKFQIRLFSYTFVAFVKENLINFPFCLRIGILFTKDAPKLCLVRNENITKGNWLKSALDFNNKYKTAHYY